jgi:hypothetical protein
MFTWKSAVLNHLQNKGHREIKTPKGHIEKLETLPIRSSIHQSTNAGLSPPHKRVISLLNREKGAWGGNSWEERD